MKTIRRKPEAIRRRFKGSGKDVNSCRSETSERAPLVFFWGPQPPVVSLCGECRAYPTPTRTGGGTDRYTRKSAAERCGSCRDPRSGVGTAPGDDCRSARPAGRGMRRSPAARAARARMRDQTRQTLQAATAEVRFDPSKSACFSGSVPSEDHLAASIPAAGTIYDCPIPPQRRSGPRNCRETGECRLRSTRPPRKGRNRRAKAYQNVR